MQKPPLHYRLFPKHPAAHIVEASVRVAQPDPAGQRFILPTWIPGSYLIREFARHLISLRAACAGAPVDCVKIDKCTWQCAPCDGPLTLTCEVYAWDLSVRAAHLDDTHGFFNGSSVFLLPLGCENDPCIVELVAPEGEAFANWQVATALSRTPFRVDASNAASIAELGHALPGAAPMLGFGAYCARNYDELIDHPIEMGCFSHATFTACGVLHHVVLTGQHRADLPRLCADLQKICTQEITFFEPESHVAPMQEYWFLILVVGDGYGGLEHRASTALICKRDDLPLAHESKISEGYQRLLGLASHEYFHTWHVKRIKPADFIPYDLTRENHTRQLWIFEGFTSYYDDLMLVRSGVIDALAYLALLADTSGRVMSQSGRHKQSLAESSFDAWIKYYRQDENSPNAQVSYYQKGALVALALDLSLRQASADACSLDDVMRALWNEYGKRNIGVPEEGVQKIAERISGLDLRDFFAHYVSGTEDPPLVALLQHVGVAMTFQTKESGGWLGAKIGAESNGDAKLQQVWEHGPAQMAGLSAGDTVVAVDGLRVTAHSLEKTLRRYLPGQQVNLLGFRRDEMKTFTVTLAAHPAQTCALTIPANAQDESAKHRASRAVWLNMQI